MARRFEAVEELLDDSLTLPAKGKDGTVRDYVIPSPSAEDGIRIQNIMDVATRAVSTGQAPADTTALDDEEEAHLYRLALGDLYDELVTELDWPWFKHVCMTVIFWVVAGMDEAERYWAAGGDPNRAAPNRAERRAAVSSAAAKSTRSRGSTSGTSTRKAVAPRRAAASKG